MRRPNFVTEDDLPAWAMATRTPVSTNVPNLLTLI